MYSRNKVLAIESIVVMFVLILLSFVVFLIVRSGSAAYGNIVREKQNSESARVAYSYINMKIKQNDSAGNVSIVDTEYGDALKIGMKGDELCTYIFFTEGTLYECLTKQDMQPKRQTANRVADLYGFSISGDGSYITVVCICESGGKMQVTKGTVGLRT
jgi:hypothetical protein